MNQIVVHQTSLSGANSADNHSICLACTTCTFDRDMPIHSGTPDSNICHFSSVQHVPETLRSSCKNAQGANVFGSPVTSKALAWHPGAHCFMKIIQTSTFHQPIWANIAQSAKEHRCSRCWWLWAFRMWCLCNFIRLVHAWTSLNFLHSACMLSVELLFEQLASYSQLASLAG